MTDLIALVNEQAEDAGLWFIDATCSEAYLQAALRKLHAAIETASPSFDRTGAWQSIETAPRDGTPILYWDKNCAIPETVCWLDGSKIASHGWYPYAGGNWFVDAEREKGAVWWPLPSVSSAPRATGFETASPSFDITAIPDGYVLMPREATHSMTMAACDSLPSCEHVFSYAGEMLRNCYRKMVEVAAVPSTPRATSPSFDINDEALNAHLRATGEWVDPYEAETESGMEIESGLTQEAADKINAEQREWLRKGYVAAFSASSTLRATGFFAQLTPEQQKAALEYDGPDSAPAATPPLAAIENLTNHQKPCDRDGVFVMISRQALDEVLAYLAANGDHQ